MYTRGKGKVSLINPVGHSYENVDCEIVIFAFDQDGHLLVDNYSGFLRFPEKVDFDYIIDADYQLCINGQMLDITIHDSNEDVRSPNKKVQEVYFDWFREPMSETPDIKLLEVANGI
jgi:hypothetical protein